MLAVRRPSGTHDGGQDGLAPTQRPEGCRPATVREPCEGATTLGENGLNRGPMVAAGRADGGCGAGYVGAVDHRYGCAPTRSVSRRTVLRGVAAAPALLAWTTFVRTPRVSADSAWSAGGCCQGRTARSRFVGPSAPSRSTRPGPTEHTAVGCDGPTGWPITPGDRRSPPPSCYRVDRD